MSMYQPEHWQRLHWQTEHRYYIAEVTQDLFGEWLLCRYWGSRTSARGNLQHLAAENLTQAQALLQKTVKRRRVRGYIPVISELENRFSGDAVKCFSGKP